MAINKDPTSMSNLKTWIAKFIYSASMWQNLKNQLEGQILLHSKFKSTITIVLQCKYGTRETMKQHYVMECFWENTREKISTLAPIFGNSIYSLVFNLCIYAFKSQLELLMQVLSMQEGQPLTMIMFKDFWYAYKWPRRKSHACSTIEIYWDKGGFAI